MTKYKIEFKNSSNDKIIRREVKTKSEIASVSHRFDKKNIPYEAREWKKNENTHRYEWSSFSPSNHCQICGRELTVFESVQRGIGPECVKKIRIEKRFPKTEEIKPMPIEIANRIYNSLSEYKKQCKFCEMPFNPSNCQYYEHGSSGWFVKGLSETSETIRQWIFFECSKCGHQYSLLDLSVFGTKIL